MLTLRELLALAEAMPGQHRALTLVGGLGGLRFGEATAMRRCDVDLVEGTVTVARTATRAGGVKRTGPRKTAAGRRTVVVPPVVADALREHLAASPVRGRGALIFPGADSGLLAPTALYGRAARTEHRNGRT